MFARVRRLFLIGVICLAVLALILFGYRFEGAGFGATYTPDGSYQPGKTLWDWLQLILVPAALLFLAQWYSQAQSKAERERQRVNEEYQSVQTFLEQIQSLILDRKLLDSQPADSVSSIARALTLTILDHIDGERKSEIIGFLDELKLLQRSNLGEPRISLGGANLSGMGAPLGVAFLDFAGNDLSFADFRNAKLDVANFENANLMGAEVSGASFIYCNFKGANLEGNFLTGVNLYGAVFDLNTTLPNGQKWNGTDLTEFGAILVPPITEKEGEDVLRELRYPDKDGL